MKQFDYDAGAGSATSESISGYFYSGDVTICGSNCGHWGCQNIGPLYAPKGEPEKRPKYDPHNARQLWQPEALAMTSKPRKRPSRQVEFNQVSKRRPVRPRYLSRKR